MRESSPKSSGGINPSNPGSSERGHMSRMLYKYSGETDLSLQGAVFWHCLSPWHLGAIALLSVSLWQIHGAHPSALECSVLNPTKIHLEGNIFCTNTGSELGMWCGHQERGVNLCWPQYMHWRETKRNLEKPRKKKSPCLGELKWVLLVWLSPKPCFVLAYCCFSLP